MLLAGLALVAATAAPPDGLEAVGVVLHPTPARSVAVLRLAGKLRVAAVGDTAFGGRVAEIAAGSVTLAFAEGHVEVRLSARGGPPAAPPQPREPAVVPEGQSRVMQREEVERRLAGELPRILAETALLPATLEGDARGVVLARIPSGTLLSDAGLLPGDVLTSLNGVTVDGLPALLSLWPRLQGESELRAVVMRAGRPVSLVVVLH
jgi:general secretion pathway protein C